MLPTLRSTKIFLVLFFFPKNSGQYVKSQEQISNRRVRTIFSHLIISHSLIYYFSTGMWPPSPANSCITREPKFWWHTNVNMDIHKMVNIHSNHICFPYDRRPVSPRDTLTGRWCTRHSSCYQHHVRPGSRQVCRLVKEAKYQKIHHLITRLQGMRGRTPSRAALTWRF